MEVSEEIDPTEKWGKRALRNPNRRKPDSLLNSQDIDVSKDHYKSIKLLQNGYIEKKKKGLNVQNTCAIDSMLHCLAYLYINDKDFNDTVNNIKTNQRCLRNASNCIIDIIITYVDEGPTDKVYKLRNELLTSMFKPSTIYNVETLDWTTNINRVTENLINQFPSLSYSVECRCRKASWMSGAIELFPINFNTLLELGIGRIQDAVNNTSYGDYRNKDSECGNCKATSTKKFFIGKVLYIDTQITDKSGNWVNTPYLIDAIPQQLHLQQKNFVLKCVIEYRPPRYVRGMGHYVCHCFQANAWHCLDDLRKRTTVSNRPVLPHLVIYTEQKV